MGDVAKGEIKRHKQFWGDLIQKWGGQPEAKFPCVVPRALGPSCGQNE